MAVAERFEARVYGHSLAGIAKSNPAGGTHLFCKCCQVEVSATGRSLVQSSPTDCDVSLCVISKIFEHEAALARVGLLHQKQKYMLINVPWPNKIIVTDLLRKDRQAPLKRVRRVCVYCQSFEPRMSRTVQVSLLASVSNRNEYQAPSLRGGGGRPERRADNLSTFMSVV
jgi:hypothetical protein